MPDSRELGGFETPNSQVRNLRTIANDVCRSLIGYSKLQGTPLSPAVTGTHEEHLTRAKEQLHLALIKLKRAPINKLELGRDKTFVEALDKCIRVFDADNSSPNASMATEGLCVIIEKLGRYIHMPTLPVDFELLEIERSQSFLEMQRLEIRPLTKEYLDKALMLADELFPEHNEDLKPRRELVWYADEERAKREGLRNIDVATQDNWILVDNADNVIGLMGLYTRAQDKQNVVWLNWFGVSKANQQSKIGEALLGEVVKKAVERGFVQMNLWTNKLNPNGEPNPAISFYRKHGFNEVPLDDSSRVVIEGHDFVVMSRVLRSG